MEDDFLVTAERINGHATWMRLIRRGEKTYGADSDAMFVKGRPFDDVRLQRIIDFGY